MANTITEQQVNFINLLKTERKVSVALIETMRTMWNNGLLTTEAANGFIQALLQFEQIDSIVAARNAIVGYHKLNNLVYRVYRSKTGSMYVKQLTVSDKGNFKMEHVDFKMIRNFSRNTLMNSTAVRNFENHMGY